MSTLSHLSTRWRLKPRKLRSSPRRRFRRRPLPQLPKRRKLQLMIRRLTRSEDPVDPSVKDKDETDNDHEATDHPENPDREVTLMEPEKTDRDAIVATVSDAPVEMVNDDRDVMETEDPDDSTANLAILDLPTRDLTSEKALARATGEPRRTN